MGGETTLRSNARPPEGGEVLPEGVEVRGKSIRLTFHFEGRRCRETLKIPATPANIKYAARLRAEVINQIERRTFDYAATFPSSKEGRRQSDKKAPVLIGPLLEAYIREASALKTLSPSTIRGKSNWAHARLIPKWGKTDARTLTVPAVRQWVISDLVPALAPVSIRNCLSTMSACLTQAVIDGTLESNPMRGMDLRSIIPRARSGRSRDPIDPFNDDEIEAILEAEELEEAKRLWTFALASGLRPGELIALRWENTHLQQSYILVSENIVTGLDGPVKKGTKTGFERIVPLLPSARSALSGVVDREGFVFKGLDGVRWRDAAQLRRAWRRTLEAACVRYRRLYQTRHTFASKLLERGESITLVANLLGHTTTAMVIKHYGRYISQRTIPALRGDYTDFAAAPKVPQEE